MDRWHLGLCTVLLGYWKHKLLPKLLGPLVSDGQSGLHGYLLAWLSRWKGPSLALLSTVSAQWWLLCTRLQGLWVYRWIPLLWGHPLQSPQIRLLYGWRWLVQGLWQLQRLESLRSCGTRVIRSWHATWPVGKLWITQEWEPSHPLSVSLLESMHGGLAYPFLFHFLFQGLGKTRVFLYCVGGDLVISIQLPFLPNDNLTLSTVLIPHQNAWNTQH